MGARPSRVARKKPVKKNRTKYSSEDETSEGYSEEESRRAASRRATTATVSYKEASEDEKTDSEDLLEVENAEPQEPVPEEKCETIERVLAQRKGRKGGTYICLVIDENLIMIGVGERMGTQQEIYRLFNEMHLDMDLFQSLQ